MGHAAQRQVAPLCYYVRSHGSNQDLRESPTPRGHRQDQKGKAAPTPSPALCLGISSAPGVLITCSSTHVYTQVSIRGRRATEIFLKGPGLSWTLGSRKQSNLQEGPGYGLN